MIFKTFLLANYRIFLNCFEISVKFCVVLIPIFALFETLKPNSQGTAQNFEKRVLQKCLIITFYTYSIYLCSQYRWEADLDQDPGLAASGSYLDLDPRLDPNPNPGPVFLKTELENSQNTYNWLPFGSKKAIRYFLPLKSTVRPDMEKCLEPDRELFKA